MQGTPQRLHFVDGESEEATCNGLLLQLVVEGWREQHHSIISLLLSSKPSPRASTASGIMMLLLLPLE